MLKVNKRILWEIYIIFLSFMATKQVFLLLSPASPNYLYFVFLVHFDKIYWFHFLLNYLECVAHFIMLIPLLGYIYKHRFGPQQIWQVFIILKAVLDIIGNDVMVFDLISYYYSSPQLCLLILTQKFIFYIPAYLVAFRFAFGKEYKNYTSLF